jgi:hypothetical protein
MKTLIPSHLTGKSLFDFLKENKKTLLQEKKARIKSGFAPTLSTTIITPAGKEGGATKAAGEDNVAAIPTVEDTGVIRVKFVANTANWMDSQGDVLLPGCWSKSITDGKGKLHLKDHCYTLASEIGDVETIYESAISLRELGLKGTGTAPCLVYESLVRKEYDARAYNRYRAGKQNQHSIGMMYVKMEMAINSEEEYFSEEYAAWNRYISQIINADEVTQQGYFFAVSEIRLLEASAVLMGSNELTPTLPDSSADTTVKQPLQSTEEQPDQTAKAFSFADWLDSKTLV